MPIIDFEKFTVFLLRNCINISDSGIKKEILIYVNEKLQEHLGRTPTGEELMSEVSELLAEAKKPYSDSTY